jgi:hypothetical protein
MAIDTKTKSKHSAAGPAAGYYFQPEIALLLLAEADSDASIAIEADDDIVERVKGETTMRAQAKHQLSTKQPFANGSVDLWKTLSIWVNAANAGEFKIENCTLLLVTNGVVGDCFVRNAVEFSKRKRKKLLEERLQAFYSEAATPYVNIVKAADINLVLSVISRIQILDGCADKRLSTKRSKVISKLSLPSTVDHDLIYQGLLGWIHDTTLILWRSGGEAWITKQAFSNRLHALVRKHERLRKIGVPARLIDVPPDIRDREINRTYVLQLRQINAEEEDVGDAMYDFVRCNSERIRLATVGDLTSEDWMDFEDSLTRHWRIKRQQSKLAPQQTPEATGYALYLNSIEYAGEIDGQHVQDYMTRGTFHRLANIPKIGWHPMYESFFSQSNDADAI